ncbi:Repeat domain-containing protein [Arenibacter palladensis]|uniref:Repeat domain-containing protein n=1 Tax=Arenibacter palladensis TaxID=237373 RepID=A0A1M5C4B4_9FLAO|nr:VCBS repeat-containing protein [Arenibacter palladensis]SHF49578.1 Repeat domain-containing protein [Arenibacter palladensis]
MKLKRLIHCLFLTLTTFGFSQSADEKLIRLQYKDTTTTKDLAVGLWANPLPMDYDQDGDLDLVISCTDVPFNGTFLFKNGSKDQNGNPIFDAPVKIGDGMRNVAISYVDGEPRVLGVGLEYDNFRRYGYTRPVGLYQASELLDLYKERFSDWKYVDYDNDGDMDLIVGIDDWSEYGWDNAFNEKGEWTNGDLRGYLYLLTNDNGKYRNDGKILAGDKPIDVYGNTTPNIADFDGDGDLDIICGEFVDRFTYFENTGSRENPTYAKGRFLVNASGILEMDLEMMRPVALDWNNDNKIDLVVGDEDGRVVFIENTGTVKDNMPIFMSPIYIQQKSQNLKFGALVTPFSVDWDDDGDEDLICGNSAGYIGFIENLDGSETPDFKEPVYLEADGKIIRIMAGESGSIQGPAERKWGYTTLTVADWDGDGLKDIVLNSIFGKVEWYRNIGTKTAPKLTKMGGVKVAWDKSGIPKPKWNWWNPEKDELATQWRTTPYAIDWNKDGLMDLVMLDHEGYLAFFERFKKRGRLYLKPGQRIFKNADGSIGNDLLRLTEREAGGSGRRKIEFTDWDGDGDLDLLANSENIEWYENVGETNGNTIFKKRGNLVNTKLAGHTTSPTVVDWDKDGKPNLLIGAEDGHFYYLKN